MATSQTGTATATPTSLKLRVLAIRDRLPANVRGLIRDRFSDLDTVKGAKKIDNVLTGGSSDEAITEFLETLVHPVAA
jgi:hypothetical protein